LAKDARLARKILLADDSVTAQNMGRKILSDAGYDVVTVNNGSAALKRVAEQKPDLIVLDVYMPGYSGLEVCQRLKDAPATADIPVLLTVGKLEPFKPEEARRVRAEAYLIKPFEASELLSAMTHLEDQMVPGGTAGNKKSDSNGDPDTGWKNRLRFPSKKKKEDPEPELGEDLLGGPTFRDFRRGRSKGRTASARANQPVPSTAPPAAPDIPRDITPEELDALSALAAKLDGNAPAAEAVAPTESIAAEPPPAPPPGSETKEEFAVAAPVVVEAVAEVPVAPVEVADAAKEDSKPSVEAPAAAEPAPLVEEPKPPETVLVRVETLAEQERSPVDREDEPSFATPPTAEPAPEVKAEVREAHPADVEVAPRASGAETVPVPEPPVEPETKEARVEEKLVAADATVAASRVEAVPAPPVEPEANEAREEEKLATAETTETEPKVEEAVPALASAPETRAEPEGRVPSEEELAAALRILTPSAGAADSSPTPSRGTLVAAGALLAEEAARSAAGAPRWMAETVALSPEEVALSLEAEMFRTLAGPAPSAEAEPVSPAEPVSEAKAPAQTNAAMTESAAAAETAAVPVQAPAETITAAPAEAAETTAPTAQAAAEAAPTGTEPKPDVEEEPAPATFADAVGREEQPPVSTEPGPEPVSAPLAAEEDTKAVATSEAAAVGEDDMNKPHGKSGKSNWHQIRSGAPASASSNDVVEAAKQSAPAVEEAPKAMAAAAAAVSTPVPASAADPSAIASIVDSVLADLRPKIVEEIAKKLAGK
jgi:CheY-like chemotaxis protein